MYIESVNEGEEEEEEEVGIVEPAGDDKFEVKESVVDEEHDEGVFPKEA